MKKITFAIVAILSCLLLFTACTTTENETDKNAITDLELSSTDAKTLAVSDTTKLWVSLTPSRGDVAKVNWYSEDATIAEIKKDTTTAGAVWCEITAKSYGATKIYAKAENGIESEKLEVNIYKIASEETVGDKYVYRVATGADWTETALRALFKKLDKSSYDSVTVFCYLDETEANGAYTAAKIERSGETVTVKTGAAL